MRTEMRSPRAVVLWQSSRHEPCALATFAMTLLFLLVSDRGAVAVVGVDVLMEDVVDVFVTAVVGGELVVTEAGFLVAATVFAGLAGT